MNRRKPLQPSPRSNHGLGRLLAQYLTTPWARARRRAIRSWIGGWEADLHGKTTTAKGINKSRPCRGRRAESGDLRRLKDTQACKESRGGTRIHISITR